MKQKELLQLLFSRIRIIVACAMQPLWTEYRAVYVLHMIVFLAIHGDMPRALMDDCPCTTLKFSRSLANPVRPVVFGNLTDVEVSINLHLWHPTSTWRKCQILQIESCSII